MSSNDNPLEHLMSDVSELPKILIGSNLDKINRSLAAKPTEIEPKKLYITSNFKNNKKISSMSPYYYGSYIISKKKNRRRHEV